MTNTQEDESFEFELTDPASGGDALGRFEGQVIFVPYALPGERVRARIEHRKTDYGMAELLEVLSPAPGRVEPPCPYFGRCGGCQWQHADYSLQLTMKRQVVVDQLRRIGRFANADELVRPTIGMVEPWEYRNHVRFTLGRKYGDMGYTYRQTHRLLRVDRCAIAHPTLNTVLGIIQRRCAGLRAHQITVRCGANTGSLLVSPVLPMVPELETGQREIEEEVLDRRFHISAASFFQVNTKRESRPLPNTIRSTWPGARASAFSMTDLLALMVLDRLDPQGSDVVVDAYCGVGTFSTLIAPHVGRVVGIEESPAAVRDARRNTGALPNVHLISERVEAALRPLLVDQPADGIILDPSRLGCAAEIVEVLIAARPPRVVYVSCDSATLARDLRLLCDGGYILQSVEPIDMFPQTHHVETVSTLSC